MDYLTDGIIAFLDRQPAQLSRLAEDDLEQMAVLHEFVTNRSIGQHPMDVAAIRLEDGRFELLCLDTIKIPGTLPERICCLGKEQLATLLSLMLGAPASQETVDRALSGTISVTYGGWAEARKSFT